MLGRRLLVLVAVLMGLTALAASLAPPPRPAPGPVPQASASPTPTPTPTPGEVRTDGETITAGLSADLGAAPRDVRVPRGDMLELTVTGNQVDTVSIPGLDVLEPLDPASPALVELLADTPGRYAIRLIEANRRIGTLDVTAG
jgi:hypothetical protein